MFNRINVTLLRVMILLTAIFFASCSDDDDSNPVIPNEEELITTLTYTLTPVGGGTVVELSFQDLDGDGGNNPVITGGTLTANTTYNASIVLLNETENPAENITEEVRREDEEHQFFFAVSDGLNLTVDYSDADENGNPLGLATTITTGDASTGNLTVTLRHEPDKSANGVSNGDITNAGGETDIEVQFNVTIQ